MPPLHRVRPSWWRVVWVTALGGLGLPALAANPEARRLNEMAVSRTAEGRYEEAAGLFSEALRLSPDDEVIRRNLAHVKTALGHQLLQAGQFEKAEAQYQAAIDMVADEVPALLGLGDALLRQRDVREAAEMYRRVVQAAPAASEGYLRLGEAYYQQGDLNGALAEWERAQSLQPQDARLRQRILGGVRDEPGGFRGPLARGAGEGIVTGGCWRGAESADRPT